VILHIARRQDWERAVPGGEYGDGLRANGGFIHASTGHQWTRPLRALFAGDPDLVLLQVDVAALGCEVRYEPAIAGDPGGEDFPHVYGTIPVAAVVAAEPIPVALTLGWAPMPFELARLTATSRGRWPDGVDEWRERGWTVTTRPDALDRDVAARFLAGHSYWAAGRSRAEFDRLVAHSLAFSLLHPDGGFAGMARVVTDRTNMAYVADVFVLPEHRGGRGAFLMRSLLEHPELGGVRHWLLATRSAHSLYRRFGFAVIEDHRWMRRVAVVAR
jgi:uncharacterized protein (DUF952 family)